MVIKSKTKLPQKFKVEAKDKSKVLCPLALKVTNGQVATNYTVDWAGTVQLTLEDVYGCIITKQVGVWRSQAKGRPYQQEFETQLKEMKMDGLIDWDQDSYYFTDEEGQEALKQYLDSVVMGNVKANTRSWNSRFAEMSGVSLDQLKNDYPKLYGVEKKIQEVQEEPKPLKDFQEADGEWFIKDDEGNLHKVPGKDVLEIEDAPEEELLAIEREQNEIKTATKKNEGKTS